MISPATRTFSCETKKSNSALSSHITRNAEKFLDKGSEGSNKFFNLLMKNISNDFQPHQLLSLYVSIKLLIHSTDKVANRMLESGWFFPDKNLIIMNSFILERNVSLGPINSDAQESKGLWKDDHRNDSEAAKDLP